jgi:hypothetical protein
MIEKINEIIIPWGSEDICYWCRKDYKCRFYSKDIEIKLCLLKSGQLCNCPIKEFELDRNRLPKEFKNCKVIMRY